MASSMLLNSTLKFPEISRPCHSREKNPAGGAARFQA
jgi:hypothetical protein